MKTRQPFMFNTMNDLPEGIKLKSSGNPENKYLFIPLGPERDLIGRQPKVHGIVILARKGNPFTEEDLSKARDLQRTLGIILDSYLNAIFLKKITTATEKGKNLILQSIRENLSIREITHKYLEIAIELIDAAEKGSVLIETPLGMKFIAALGYDEDILLNLPPLDPQITKIQWYGMGEDKLNQGIPRIITDKELKAFRTKDPLTNILPEALDLRSNLMIPVVVKGRMLLEVNLDNFSEATAFDDMDIEIAKHLATYMTASYELIVRGIENDRNGAMIKQLTSLMENFSQSTTNLHIKDIFLHSVVEGVDVLKPYAVLSTSDKRQFQTRILYGKEEHRLEEIFKQICHELLHSDKQYDVFMESHYSILVYKQTEEIDGDKISFFLGFVKYHDIWTETDIHHVINTIKVSALLAKNVVYMQEISATQEDTLSLLGKALEFRDLETKGHTERTAYMTSIMADAINFPDKKGIMWGAYVHDIGKIAIPDYILLKPGKLTKEEFEIMKKHVIYGYRLLSGIRRIPQTTLNVVKYHHEKWDGTGYPEGLKGEEIPLEARIFAIIDVFDALISKRPYKEAWPIDKAISVIKEGKGKHFDPYIVDTFLDLIANTDLVDKLKDITEKAYREE
ncbi:MAG: HD domain-containing protein [Dictyoglomi bacterium]|nr:HD domain-containing protein [Dictyoglomota bacterium]